MGLLRSVGRGARFLSPHNSFIAITGAAQQVRRGQGPSFERLAQPWQAKALDYYDKSGPAWYAANFYGKALSQIRLFPARKDENGDIEEVDDEQALEILNRVQDPMGGRAQILGTFGRLMFLTGEGYLLVTGTEDGERWEFVSNNEIKIDAAGSIERRGMAPGVPGRYVAPVDPEAEALEVGEAIAYRFWRRSPAASGKADSPMRAVLDLFDELIMSQKAIRARQRSRLASAGFLLIPEEINFPSPDNKAADEDVNSDPFIRALIAHMTRPIQNEGSASSVVPLVIRGMAEYLKEIRHVRVNDPDEVYREQGLRKETLSQIAIGLDLPPEVLTGLADSNHWTAWQIDEQVAKQHIFPVCQLWCEDFTASYFRPACEANGVADWEDMIVWYDAAEVVVHPDQSSAAQALYDRRAIGKRPLREAHGFDDDDAPTEEELDEMLGVALHDKALALGDEEGEQPAEAEQTGGFTTELPPGASRYRPIGQPPQPIAASANGNGYVDAQILGAAESTVERARERAGSRLRSRVRGVTAQLIDGVPNSLVAATLGREVLADMDVSPISLVSGARDLFVLTAARRWNLSEAAAAALGEQIEMHAARSLLEQVPPQLPSGFSTYLAQLHGDD